MKLGRRQFMLSAVGFAAAAANRARAQSTPELILREKIVGDTRYVNYASRGNYLLPSSPSVISTDISKIFIYYPLNISKAQIVVFSHDALSDPTAYKELIWHWTSHGHVVFAPLHDDSVILNGPSIRKRSSDQLSEWPVPALLEDKNAWKKRMMACQSVLDLAEPLTRSIGIEMDFTRPVIAGHGYGAFIANLLMGAHVLDHNKEVIDYRDDRFFSSISLSPQGPGVMGLTDDSWSAIASPMLGIVAENEQDFTGQPWREKGKSFKLAMPGYKHFALLTKGTASSFTGQLGVDAHEAKLFEGVRAMTTCFIKAYSEYDMASFGDMATNFFQRNTLNAIQEYKR